MNILDQARKDIIAILKKAGIKATPADIVFPPNAEMGDFSFPLFKIAKQRNTDPGRLSKKLKLKPQGLIAEIRTTGPYVNFALNKERVAKDVLNKPQLQKLQSGKRVMVEMVSPNNNKPLHLGHLRNAFLGESVSRLLKARGNKIIRTCLFNDRGLQFTKSMLGYKLWGKNTTPQKSKMKGDKFVVKWYVKFEKESKKDENLELQAKKMVRLWEQGDKPTLALWKKMSDWANSGINHTLDRINMKFDELYFEHQLWKKGKAIVAKALKKDIFQLGEGDAVVVEFPKENLPPKVVQRSDGTAIYTTTDLILGELKFKKYKLNHAIWCVGQEQNLAFKQLFAIYKQLGYKWHKNCEHLTYAFVDLPEGRMKTREGTVVEADDLLDEMHKLAAKETKKRHKKISTTELKKRAEILSQAAIRYYLLHVGPKNTIQFDPKKSLAFTGNTGPYLLYTYARIASILRKARNTKIQKYKNKPTDAEWQLLFGIARFNEMVADAAQQRDPSHLAKYLYDLTRAFSDFYETSPVLKAKEPTKSFRLALIKKFQDTLKEGLQLLTIETVEEM